jgi:hypothetical protein
MQDHQRNDKTTFWREHLVAYVVKVCDQIIRCQIDHQISCLGGDEVAPRTGYLVRMGGWHIAADCQLSLNHLDSSSVETKATPHDVTYWLHAWGTKHGEQNNEN